MDILTAEDLGHALSLLHQNPQAEPLAGGTDLFVTRKQYPGRLKQLVDLSAIAPLKAIRREGDVLHLGPGLTAAQLEQADLPRGMECLRQAASHLGGPQIRNRATIGGNLQTASPAGDLSAALLALNASVELTSTRGTRTLPLQAFFLGVKRTAKNQDEIITDIQIPVSADSRSLFLKVGQRNALAISVISLTVLRTGSDYRLVFGSAAPTVRLAEQASQCLSHSPDPDGIRRAKELLRQDLSPITDVRASAQYRLLCAAELLEQAITGWEESF